MGRSIGARRCRRADSAGGPTSSVCAGHHLARGARLARAPNHVHPRRSGDSLDHFRRPGAVEHDRARDLQPAPTRMEGQLEQRNLPELFHELVYRRHDRRLRRARSASLRRAVRERRQRRRKRCDYARIDQPDVRSGSRPAPLGARRHDRAIDLARQCAGSRRVQSLDARGSRSVLRHLSCAADQGRRDARRPLPTCTSTVASSRRCGCRPDDLR